MALHDDFEAAIERVNALPSAPATDVQLQLYGLFKQATNGDVTGARPGRLSVRARAKYDAWAARKGTAKDDAMQAYIDLASRLAR